jgi:hypothetical protein
VADVFYKVIVSEIDAVLSRRNSLTPEPAKMMCAQFAHFTYSDGALMMTVGIVLHTAAETPTFDSCALNQLNYFRGDASPYQIQVPALTSREISHLNSQLPSPRSSKKAKKLVCEGVTARDIEIYSEIYRFFPNYSEVLWT